MSAELVDSVQEALTVSEDDFAATVEREAKRLKAEIRDGTFDNPQAIVGLEYELYGVAENDATLERMPVRCWNSSTSRANWACTTPSSTRTRNRSTRSACAPSRPRRSRDSKPPRRGRGPRR